MASNKLTPEEQAIIDKQIQELKEKQRQAELDAIARNKFLDEQRKQPGYTGY